MRRWIAAAIAGMVAVMPVSAGAADGNPTCVLMKFTDDTRFDAIETAASLSDLLMEKMVASGRFNLKETRPLDENMERMLYDEKTRELAGFEAALSGNDFSKLFEGPGFSEEKAQSIATASLGQIVTPSITGDIGRAHGVEYLLQGTIVNLGTGNWWNEDYALMSQAINMAASLAAAPIASALGGAMGPLGGLLGNVDVKRTGIGVQSDVRLIKASTGEVVWSKRMVGICDQNKVTFGGLVSIGTDKLTANLYTKAMDRMATRIVDELIADMDAGKLFVK